MHSLPHPNKPWSAAPLVNASIALHALAAGSLLVAPQVASWALGAVLFNHAALTAAGLWPRSQWLGPNLTRLPAMATARGAVALTIDDGPDPEVTPAVLDLLQAHGVRATFFCIADRVRAHPALARDIIAQGHSVQNHSLRHRHDFALRGPAALRREIGDAQHIVADVCGVAPHCFRAPAGLRNPFLDRVLHELDLQLVSWTRRGFDTRDGNAQRVLGRLAHKLAAGDILLLHDGHAQRTAQRRPLLLDVLPPLIARCAAQGLHFETLRESVARRSGLDVAPDAVLAPVPDA